jgi:hypothetical protein
VSGSCLRESWSAKELAENEQQPDKKKPGLLRRAFKWIGLSFLVLLLIAAVIFQAPWKVITLLAIVLAACTVLPKPFRKWFWLSVAAVVIVLIIWVFLPEDNEGWRPYTFDKELAELKAQYAIPDEENAAFAYEEIFENLDVVSDQPEFFVKSKPSSKDEPWLSKDHSEMAEWLEGQQDAIEKLLQAAKKNKCIFLPIRADLMSYSEYMEHLPKIRQCAFLLISAANNDIAEGRINAALEKHFCITRMANHMYQQPTTIQHLVGFAIESLALQRLNRFVIEGRPDQKKLLLISDSIIGVENNWSTDWPKVLDFEKLYGKNMICCMFYEVNTQDKIRISRGQLTLTNEQFKPKKGSQSYCRRKLFKARTILFWFYLPPLPEKISEMFDTDFEKHYAMAKSDFDWNKAPADIQTSQKVNYGVLIEMLTSSLGSAYQSVHNTYVRNLALRRGSRLLIAIKKYHNEHGTWPESLNAIKSGVPAEAFIDPANGNKFEYENHGKRFSLFAETINIWPK